jgi:hypothetical protein
MKWAIRNDGKYYNPRLKKWTEHPYLYGTRAMCQKSLNSLHAKGVGILSEIIRYESNV